MTSEEARRADEAVFKALLDATVYAHIPAGLTPSGRIRFIQFVRPDNQQTVLPFFSDRDQAEAASAGKVGIVAMGGRRFFELTTGATLMLNPNLDQVSLYPPEVKALLAGRPLGFFAREVVKEGEQAGMCPPTVTTDALVIALRALFEQEPAVRAGYLVQVHPEAEGSQVFLLMVLIVVPGNEERLLHLTTLEMNSISLLPELPINLACVSPDAPILGACRHGVQFYGT
jgi:hypothetical protein